MNKHHDFQTTKTNRAMEKMKYLTIVFLITLFSATSLYSQILDSKTKGRPVKKDGVIAYIVRDSMEKSVVLTMLIAHKTSFSQRVEKMVGEPVVPLTFSISSSLNREPIFNPTSLQFVQGNHVWTPDSLDLEESIIRLNEAEPFGGIVKKGQTHQAVVLLPTYFNIDEPLYVNYHHKEFGAPMVTARKGE